MVVSGSGVYVTVQDNFIAEPERVELLNFFSDMEKSDVCSDNGEGELHDSRTGDRKWLNHDESLIVRMLCERISLLVGIPIQNAEIIQLLEYGEGEKYDPHFDAFDKSQEEYRHYGQGGQRLITVMGYLTDIYVGGATVFPALGLEVHPRSRRLLVWNNCDEDTSKPHPNSLHGGMPVGQGIKRCFTIWFRENPINESTEIFRQSKEIST